MSKIYTAGRGSAADIRTPKEHDAVGKVHLQLEDAGGGQARVSDLKSTNGTFVRVGAKWEEIKGTRLVSLDAELMLGDYKITPRRLLSAVAIPASEKKYRSSKEQDMPTPVKKRTGPRRNAFGEIVLE
jgi:pSer/pThr/pTyr-binding forkhead associated (FHA) protein